VSVLRAFLVAVALLSISSCGKQLSFTIPVCTSKGVDCACSIPGWIICHDVCVDPRWNRDHCGACDQRCGQLCAGGQCGDTCGTVTQCGQVCADTTTDPYHCGGCNQVCEGACRGTCRLGTASCPAGQTLCPGGCSDLSRDPDNCGVCGQACPTGSACYLDHQLTPSCCRGKVCGADCIDPGLLCP